MTVETELGNMQWQTVMMLIQTILVLFGFGLAYRQFRRWREEVVGGKQIDLAVQIGKAAIRVEHEFKIIRQLMVYPTSATVIESEKIEHLITQKNQDALLKFLEELRPLIWEGSLLFDVDLNKDFEALWGLYVEWAFAGFMLEVYNSEKFKSLTKGTKVEDEKLKKVVYEIAGSNEFGSSISEVVKRIVDFAQKTIKQSKASGK